MPVRNLSSTVRFKASDASPEVRRRYGLYDDEAAVAAELDQPQTGDGGWRQDQRLKNDITSVLHRLELDSVKPSFDVLAQTGFRRGYQVRGRKPSRRHSYIEPRVVHHHLEQTAPSHEERTVRFSEPEPVHHHHHHHAEPSHSSAYYYTEPRSYSSFQRSTTVPPVRRSVAHQPEGGRALSEYRETLGTVPAPVHQHHQQRWSVYGAAAPATDWQRSRSTPPDFHRRSTAPVPIGDRLTRRRNHEFAIGVKLAESQSDLDTFSRMLDRRFGGNYGGGDTSRTSYGVYPSYPSTYYTSPLFYEYERPVTSTDYRYDLYSPRTRVVKPSGTVVYSNPYSYSDYLPYSTYSKYVPYSHVDYGRTYSSVYEPGYPSYYPRSDYYVGRSRYRL